MSRGRAPKKDSGGGANWMDTYGDLVTLLLCFFVLLYAFSSVDSVKWEKLVEVFTGSPPAAIMEPVDPSMPIEGLSIDDIIPSVYMTKIQEEETQDDQTVEKTEDEEIGPEEQDPSEIYESLLELTEELQGYVAENELEGRILVDEESDIVYITMREGVLFDSGRAEIKAEGEVHLKAIGDIIYKHMNEVQRIVAVGHTDDRPINTSYFADNFDLSNKRAAETIRYISDNCNIAMQEFRSFGMGEWEPIATNDTVEGRAQNRRVELMVVSELGDLGDVLK